MNCDQILDLLDTTDNILEDEDDDPDYCEIKILLGIHMKMSTLEFPRVKMYWSSKNGTRIPAIADVMPVNKSFQTAFTPTFC